MRQLKAAARPAREDAGMAKRFPIAPAHPERTCWGCDRYCASGELACGNGSERTQHPAELFGADWAQWGLDPFEPALALPAAPPPQRTD